MTRSIIRSADWHLGPETAPEAPGIIFEATCTTCGEASGATNDDRLPAEIWALKHAGRTGHTGFAEDVRRFWRATLIG
ncbi:hypothetical protein OG905_11220 [Streptomyces sp. NBC_00322]|uniref:DUF7848 domain-containing protein n=1 Tax=Streptomyces sp. NBC_00322 TaxID=2975712 RepID=UPI002E2DA141|nr:hypothetical protein [Streptomyces sp. NBC_00322]